MANRRRRRQAAPAAPAAPRTPVGEGVTAFRRGQQTQGVAPAVAARNALRAAPAAERAAAGRANRNAMAIQRGGLRAMKARFDNLSPRRKASIIRRMRDLGPNIWQNRERADRARAIMRNAGIISRDTPNYSSVTAMGRWLAQGGGAAV